MFGIISNVAASLGIFYFFTHLNFKFCLQWDCLTFPWQGDHCSPKEWHRGKLIIVTYNETFLLKEEDSIRNNAFGTAPLQNNASRKRHCDFSSWEGWQMCGDLDKHENEWKAFTGATQNVKAINRESKNPNFKRCSSFFSKVLTTWWILTLTSIIK